MDNDQQSNKTVHVHEFPQLESIGQNVRMAGIILVAFLGLNLLSLFIVPPLVHWGYSASLTPEDHFVNRIQSMVGDTHSLYQGQPTFDSLDSDVLRDAGMDGSYTIYTGIYPSLFSLSPIALSYDGFSYSNGQWINSWGHPVSIAGQNRSFTIHTTVPKTACEQIQTADGHGMTVVPSDCTKTTDITVRTR